MARTRTISDRTPMSCLWVVFFLCGILLIKLKAGEALTITNDQWVTIGMNATITCLPERTGSTDIQWKMSDISVSDVDAADFILDYLYPLGTQDITYGPGIVADHYAVQESSDGSSFSLTVKSVTLDDDSKYWCQFVKFPPFNPQLYGTTIVRVRVAPSTIAIAYDGTSHVNNGDVFPVVAGNGRQFICSTPGINPESVFTWNLVLGSSTSQPQGSQMDSPNSVDDRLTDSSSTITVDIPETEATGQLTCGATNRQDEQTGTEMDISVTLQIKVPPKASSMSLSGFSGPIPGSVDQGSQRMIQCMVPGTRPAATIEWYLDGMKPTSGTSTTSQAGQNNLIDTTGNWTFIPSRGNHDEEVRCEASTPESQAPSVVMVTLKVSGPPDPPVITGVTSPIMEDVEINLTCEADMGYPEDWRLDWANGGSGITGPSTMSSVSGSRFMFSSTWDFTPQREDNGNNITCTAAKTAWTPGPVASTGPIDVQFCARFVTFTGCLSTIAAGNMVCCPSAVTAGDMVSFTCTSGSSNPATTLTISQDSDDVVGPTDESIPGDHGGRVTSITYSTGVLSKTNNGDMYSCCATNAAIPSCTTPLCQTCTLNVEYAPEFTMLTQLPDSPVTEGSSVTLACTVDANPRPRDITWKKQDSSDAFSSVYNDVTSTLTLSDIRREHAGYYMCQANNGVPSDDPNDVISDLFTVIVHYEVNITNKATNEVGVNEGDNAVLTCIAVGNPKPAMDWYGPNNTVIFNGTEEGKFLVTNKTTGGDGVYGFEVTSMMTVNNIDSDVDFGKYTCISSNGIGEDDSLNINITGTRRPDKPTRVEITEQTAESLTVTWTPGYDGGETQSFRVSCIKASDSTEVFSEEIPIGGNTTSTATGLDDYTEYEIRVYARNSIGESIGYGNTKGYTLPNPPGPESGITVKYNKQGGTVEVEGLIKGNGCIQLEVQYEGNDTWQECGACITSDQIVTLPDHCASSQKRRRQAVGDIVAVQSKYCFGSTCSEPAAAEIVEPTNATPLGPDIGLIVGATLGGLVLITIIVVLIVYLVRTSPKKRNSKEDSFSPADDIQDVELQEQSHDVQPEENNGITNQALQNNDTYAQVNKTKLPPKPQSARSAPTNLPDVTYAEVNRDKKPKPPPDDYAAKKKPKKYVPPSSRAAEESAYEEVQISDKDKAKIPPAAASADTYASVGGQQDTSGRVVTEDGLIYAEVGHMKQHPVDQPPIQTEESTEYASLDFTRMKQEDK